MTVAAELTTLEELLLSRKYYLKKGFSKKVIICINLMSVITDNTIEVFFFCPFISSHWHFSKPGGHFDSHYCQHLKMDNGDFVCR